MLRSLYSGITGLRSHQTMLDVTGNNIANVNTTGFKASSTQFRDTLSQLTQGAGAPQGEAGGTNPAQVGLGVQVAGIATSFTQGSAQATGQPTDMMLSGDGFFLVSSGGETLYTRAGSFRFDAEGTLVGPGGERVLGWGAVDGVVQDGGQLGPITLPLTAINPAAPTTAASVTGNLPSDAEVGAELVRDIITYDAEGGEQVLVLTFTRTAEGWTAAGGGDSASLTFTDGALDDVPALTVGGVAIDLSAVTGFAELETVSIAEQNGREAGGLESYTLGADGTLTGLFSNGERQALGRIAVATFANPSGLEKVGGSSYRGTVNSGAATIGAPGADGAGTITTGALEMSNVDLSQEFTNLIVAQRGFQANARIITTSDEVLQELTNLKR